MSRCVNTNLPFVTLKIAGNTTVAKPGAWYAFNAKHFVSDAILRDSGGNIQVAALASIGQEQHRQEHQNYNEQFQ